MGPPADRSQAIAVLRRAVEVGVDHIDTAQFYGPDVANELIRAALHPYPPELVIATKVGASRDRDRGWPHALTPAQLREDVLANIESLGVERLDVVNLRIPNEGIDRPIGELLGPLVALREEGLIAAIGVSAVDVEQLQAARAITEIAQAQVLYNVVNRSSQDVVDACARHGVAFVPFFPLGAAWPTDDVLGNPTVAAVAARRGVTVAQVALAWLLAAGEHILLIPGTSSIAHLQENVAAGDVRLERDDLAELDAIAAGGADR